MPDHPQAKPGRLLQDLALSVHTGAQGEPPTNRPGDTVVHGCIRDDRGSHLTVVYIAMGKGGNGFDSTVRVVWARRRRSPIGIETESEIQPFTGPQLRAFTLLAAFLKQGTGRSRPLDGPGGKIYNHSALRHGSVQRGNSSVCAKLRMTGSRSRRPIPWTTGRAADGCFRLDACIHSPRAA